MRMVTNSPNNPDQLIIYRASALADATGRYVRPGWVSVRSGVIQALGEGDPPTGQPVIDRTGWLLVPAMVNSHAHLGLTNIGPQPAAASFIDWLGQVIERAPREELAVTQSVQQGVELSKQAGVGWVGDIAHCPQALWARFQADLPGVGFAELIGRLDESEASEQINDVLEQARASEIAQGAQERTGRCVLGLSPHAPYSTGQTLYDQAAKLGQQRNLPVTTHLAESLEEIEFVRQATGPFAQMLQQMGKWSSEIEPTGQHPIDWLLSSTKCQKPFPWLLAHCNYIETRHIDLLRQKEASVVYCPIASDYFGHPHEDYPPHQYKEMLAGGVNVCLGTDSILCQPAEEPQPLGILPQMRFLFRRDRTDPLHLLNMATTNGLVALGFPSKFATLVPEAPARFTALPMDEAPATMGLADTLAQILEDDRPAELVLG